VCLILFGAQTVRNRAFSLLEVILALAILGGSIAVLGEAGRLALRNAEYTRDMARAQVLCESKMSEILSGVITDDPIQRATIEDAAELGEPAWLYSIETESLDDEGLESVRVTVERELPPQQHPAKFSLVRWIANSKAVDTTSQDSATQQPAGGTSTTTPAQGTSQ
jgi:general secretion pathway protein I